MLDHKKSHDSPKVVGSFAKDTPELVRDYGQDQKWVKGWVVKATIILFLSYSKATEW